MIYLAAAVALLTIARYTGAVRAAGSYAPLRDILRAILGGLAGGVLLAIAARGGMALITMANGSAPRITFDGTTRVLLTFIGMGGAIGIAYAGLFGSEMSRRGLLFGALLAVVTVWPLRNAAAQVLAGAAISPGALIIATALVVCLMWLPYALVLESVVAALNRR